MAGSWIEIRKEALEHNVRVVRNALSPKTQLMAVVKSNAYGHGLVEASRVFAAADVDWFGVGTIDEGITLRQAGIAQPILVLNPTEPAALPSAIEYDLAVMAGSMDWIRQVGTLPDALSVHLKVDTGMGRQGVLPTAVHDAVSAIADHEHLQLTGLATHFCCADDPAHEQTERQHARFEKTSKALQDASVAVESVHAAASAAALAFPETHYDMVRSGIALYGLNPFSNDAQRMDHNLHPTLTWKTTIAFVNNVPAGWCVGYGCTERLENERRIAVLPVGYADGYDRRLSSRGSVLVRGKRAPVMGRVSMNLITIDVTAIPNAAAGDEVVLTGSGIPVDDLAEHIGTIHYEVVTRIGAHLPRHIV